MTGLMAVNPQEWHVTFRFPLALLLVANSLCAQDAKPSTSLDQTHCESPRAPELQSALDRTRVLIERIRTASYPELKAAQIQVRSFESASDFFRARPRIPDFFLRKKLRYVIQVNPKACELQVPEYGVKAIMAHELSHVAYLKKRNRLRLLAMVPFLSGGFVRDFERRADMEAISRGYGEGLKAYRQWLYQHIPQKSLAEKRRNYFSPEEINSILLRIRQCPHLLDYWLKKPPRNPPEVQSEFVKTCAEH